MHELNHDLFDEDASVPQTLCDGASVLREFALERAPSIIAAIEGIATRAPFRHMRTPGGHRMSVAMTNCGTLGWVTDPHGYRYSRKDPLTDRAWPAMPAVMRELAQEAANNAGFKDFDPDACLINRYDVGARMSLHQDRNERDFQQPIVSVSLGLPVVFLFGGMQRADRALRIPLSHGDVVVWGGPARLRFHGVLPLKSGNHALSGESRINLTFRRAA